MSDLRPVEAADSVDPVAYAEIGELSFSGDPTGVLWGLYYSIYYGGKETALALPESVLKAFGRVQEVLRG